MTRIWRFALLTLLIALLPLRGWAWAVMPVQAPAHSAERAPIAQAEKAPAAHAAHLPPCHAAQASPADAPSDATAAGAHPSDTQGSGQAHTCSLCDLCHAGVIAPPNWAWFHDAPPIAKPSWAVSVAQGRDDGEGLFRPPRA